MSRLIPNPLKHILIVHERFLAETAGNMQEVKFFKLPPIWALVLSDLWRADWRWWHNDFNQSGGDVVN